MALVANHTVPTHCSTATPALINCQRPARPIAIHMRFLSGLFQLFWAAIFETGSVAQA
jgi:hypothetical protein